MSEQQAESKTAPSPAFSDRPYPGSGGLTMSDLAGIAYAIAQSGQYVGSRTQSQALVKILRGIDMGLKPTEGPAALHIIGGDENGQGGGKPALEAVAMASLIQRSGRFYYEVTAHTDKECEIVFHECATPDGQGGLRPLQEPRRLGVSAFTLEDAKKAKLPDRNKNWEKYPRNQLFARAMSNGCRWYCSAVFGGPVYSLDELEEIEAPAGNGRVKAPQEPSEPRAQATTLPEAVEAARKAAGLGKGRAEMLHKELLRGGKSEADIVAAIFATKRPAAGDDTEEGERPKRQPEGPASAERAAETPKSLWTQF